jgi:hypothetical protein
MKAVTGDTGRLRQTHSCSMYMQDHKECVRFDILIAVTIKSTIFWDVTLCSLVENHQRFGM